MTGFGNDPYNNPAGGEPDKDPNGQPGGYQAPGYGNPVPGYGAPGEPQWGAPNGAPGQPGFAAPQYPAGGYGMPGQQYAQGPAPDNYLVWAILSTVFCCIPFGIVSIVFAAKVNGLWAQGLQVEAKAASDKAKMWAIIAAATGLVVSVLWGIAIVASGS